MKKICVTGANGFLGSWLIKKLNQEGHQVRILARKTSNLSELNGCDYEVCYGDITDEDSLVNAFKGQESVFHLAGLITYKSNQRSAMEKINVQGTQNVLAAINKSEVSDLVHLSSVVAVGAGFSQNQILNENSEFNLHEYNLGYFETKLAAEKLVLKAFQETQLPVVILNPSTIYGPGDAQKGSRKTQVKVAREEFPFYTSGGVSIIDVEDCIEGIVAAWEKGKKGHRYILSGDNITIRQLFELIAKAANVTAPRFQIPNLALHTIGRIGDALNKLSVSSSLSYENSLVASLYHWFDNSKARNELGLNPKSAEHAITRSVSWMKQNGYLD